MSKLDTCEGGQNMKKFNVFDMLNSNSQDQESDNQKENTVMLSVFDIEESKSNFYSTADVDDLADSIEMLGIQQNLVVKKLDEGKYGLIAGHRRRLACLKLVNEGKKDFENVPCIIETSNDPVKEKLILILTNATARELSDYEKVEQARQLKELLIEYKENHNIPGRVRDLVADTLKVSPTQVARMDSISNNLSEDLKKEFKKEKINISTAYEISGLDSEQQKEVYKQAKEKESNGDSFNISLKEIKERKKEAENVFEPEQQQQAELEISEKDKWLIRYKVLKEMCNALCKMHAYILESSRYSMDKIEEISTGTWSFSFGNDGEGYGKYSAEFKEGQYKVTEFDGEGSWIFEHGEIEQHIWNFNGRDWCREHSELAKKQSDDPESDNDILKFKDEKPGTETKSSESDEPVEASDGHEILEADIIQTEKDPEAYSLSDVKNEIQKNMDYLEIGRKENIISVVRYKTRMNVDALIALLDKMQKLIEEPDQEQPELPALKNNDQRKEFIDNYETWPVWIDQAETGEKYYRYILTDKVAIVVKVSWKHTWETYKETKNCEYGAEQYYLLGVKTEWHSGKSTYVEDDTRTFYECSTNKSALVDYLKEFQKK